MRFEGDDFLSGSDRHLWSLCYSTLEKFGCLVAFKVNGPYSSQRVNRQVSFFVPGHHPKAEEVREYLLEELRNEIMAESEIDGQWAYGTQVRVMLFSGVDGYLTHEQMEPLVEKAVEDFYAQLEERQRKAVN